MPKAPGQAHRKGISVIEFAEIFPNEEAARKWFEAKLWPKGRYCPRCEGKRTREVKNHKPMPYWCTDCRKYFSVKTGTVMEASRLPLLKWAYGVYMHVTNLKGISSMKLHRDIRVTQKTAWYMLHRIRNTFDESEHHALFEGPVEVDETYIGGKESNKHKSKKTGNLGTQGKVAVVGMKDRDTGKIMAEVVPDTSKETLQDFVMDHVLFGTPLYTDEHKAYSGLDDVYDHETVKHSVCEYVRGKVHTNGIESFWAALKRSKTGVYHRWSKKHLQRYVDDLVGRTWLRDLDTLDQMVFVAEGMRGKRLRYKTLIQ